MPDGIILPKKIPVARTKSWTYGKREVVQHGDVTGKISLETERVDMLEA